MLTKLPMDLVEGNGHVGTFIMYDGSSLKASDIKFEPDTRIGNITYDRETGTMTLFIIRGNVSADTVAQSNSDSNASTQVQEAIVDTVTVKGFVRVADLRQGRIGNSGHNALNGINGLNGLDGMNGIQGPRGFKGFKGQEGIPGPRGYQGIEGEKGEDGERGDPGPVSPKGRTGIQGKQGDIGLDGINENLVIVVSEADPGAIGAGTIWVHPKNFTHGKDKVNFSEAGNKEDLKCIETIRLIREALELQHFPTWFHRDLNTTLADESCTYTLQYLASCLDEQGNLIMLAQAQTVDGPQTVMLMHDYLTNTEMLFEKCVITFYDNRLFIVESKRVTIIEEYEVIFSEDITLNMQVNAITCFKNSEEHLIIAIATDYGFFGYNVHKKTLLMFYKRAFENVFKFNDRVFLTSNGYTYSDTFDLNDQREYSGKVFESEGMLYYANYANSYLAVFTLDNALLYSMQVDAYRNNVAYKGNALYIPRGYGLQYMRESFLSHEVLNNYIVEYTDDTIFVELL